MSTMSMVFMAIIDVIAGGLFLVEDQSGMFVLSTANIRPPNEVSFG